MIKKFGISSKMRDFEEMRHHSGKLSKVFTVIGSPSSGCFGVVLRIVDV